MGPNTKVNFLMINIIIGELMNGQMGEFIGDSGTKDEFMELEYLPILMVNLIVVNIKMIKNMAMESIDGHLDKYYMQIGKKENNMD